MPIKVALLTPPTRSHRTAEETLALGYLGAQLRNSSYEVRIVDGWLEQLNAEEMVDKIAIGGAPAIVGFSCYRSNLEQAKEVLGIVRERFGNIPSLCGGYGPTFHDEEFLTCGFTVAVRGEAENSIADLIDALLKDNDLAVIPGITFRKNGQIVRTERIEPITNLDLINMPARDTISSAINQHNFVHMSTSRGCTANCIFCSIIAFDRGGPRKVRWRQRSIKNIVAEVEALNKAHGVHHFKFVDDSFIEHPRDEHWAEELRDELLTRDLQIKFRTQVRADKLTPRLTRILKEAGWFSTSVGVENASSNALKRMGKSADQAQNLAALGMLEQNEIYVQMGMILFDPYTTMSELWENLTFLKTHPWPINKGVFTEMFAAEGTPFTRLGQKRGFLSDATNTQNYAYSIQDEQSRRMYAILKTWHRSHSTIYDWVIDPLTAPKVLPEDDYREAHALCKELQTLDLRFFERALLHVSDVSSASDDPDLVQESIYTSVPSYLAIENRIGILYARNGLKYEAEPNPFLGLM